MTASRQTYPALLRTESANTETPKTGQDFEKDIHIDMILPSLKASGMKHLFQLLSCEIAERLKCEPTRIFSILSDSENTSPSALGNGVAIPHGQAKTLFEPITVLANLSQAINFDAMDERPVDLVCVLLSPERDGPLHLRRLSRLSRLLKSSDLRAKIKDTNDEATIRSLLINPQGWMLAA